ncbi:hypothetical protein IQ07DRAFT_202955 [Pyrenochaeta sp. DS3sAY3a]|nr:hypothetical protein IQ07DRAFT_202955 [Pyrenochaeta sp. DS3sAY3a]
MKTWENYAQQLKDDFSCALWHTEEESRVNPGAVGWLDDDGIWRYECHLKDDSNFASLPPPVENKMSNWGPRSSRSIESQKVEFTAAARPGHVPVKFTSSLSYSSYSSAGALLVTKNIITRKQYDYDDDFERWVYAYARKLRENNSQLGMYGFYVVSTTYTAEQCWSTAWRKKVKKGKLHLQADVYEAANIDGSHEWLVDHTSTTWNASPTRDGRMTVVAFGGLYFRYCMVRWTLLLVG